MYMNDIRHLLVHSCVYDAVAATWGSRSRGTPPKRPASLATSPMASAGCTVLEPASACAFRNPKFHQHRCLLAAPWGFVVQPLSTSRCRGGVSCCRSAPAFSLHCRALSVPRRRPSPLCAGSCSSMSRTWGRRRSSPKPSTSLATPPSRCACSAFDLFALVMRYSLVSDAALSQPGEGGGDPAVPSSWTRHLHLGCCLKHR